MYGINNQPMIELDPYVDVAGFASLKHEMDLGIARSTWEPGSFGPGVYEKQLDRDLYNIEIQLVRGEHPDAATVGRALASLPTSTQQRRYLKLRYGLFNSSHSVYLRKPIGHNYLLIGNPEQCAWTGDEQHFPNLTSWIKRLPFAGIGRILFFVNEHLCPVVPHSDLKHSLVSRGYVANHAHQHEFIWIRPSVQEGKSFYVLDEATQTKHYVQGHACWFNSFDVHGADPSPIMTYSLRVDGRFTDDFRRALGLVA